MSDQTFELLSKFLHNRVVSNLSDAQELLPRFRKNRNLPIAERFLDTQKSHIWM